MNFSRLFILRPIATTLLMAAVLLVGIAAYRLLPLSALPEVDYPTIQVVTLYPGASPEVIGTAITAPLERQFGQIPGLNQMSSSSSGGASVITLQFRLDLSLDVAQQDVQAAINAAAQLLPTDLPTPPIYSKVNPADAPVLTLALTSSVLPLFQVEDLADTRLAQKISQVTGVGQVSVSGGNRPAVRVKANPRALAAYGMSLEELRASIVSANVNQAKGSFDGAQRSYILNANDQLKSANEFKSVVVAYRNGSPITLSDVAEVVEGAENEKLAAWHNQEPAIILNVQRQPGANVIEVVDRIKALLPELQQSLPPTVKVSVVTDRTVTIRTSISDIQFELMLAIALVVMVIFLFLRNVPATVIPSLAVPLSLLGTFGFMYLAGFSVNNLTLMALTIATGFVVDDAIVMIENIARHIEEGETPLDAAIKGSKQITFTILSLTASLIAVLIPLLFMGDVAGRLFREFAITLAVAILISAVISLTLTPMLCARLLRHEPAEKHGWLYRVTGQFFDRLIQRYGVLLERVLNHQTFTLGFSFATLVLTIALYVLVPKGFFPSQDAGLIQGISEAPQNISFAAMSARQQSLVDAILQDPAVESVSSFVGVDGTNTTLNSGRLLITLKPHEQRDVSASEIVSRLQPELAQLDGISLYLQPVQDLTIETHISRSQYQISVQDPNAGELHDWTEKLVDRLAQLPELTDVTSDIQDGGLQAYVAIDRDTSSRLGITTSDVTNALYNAFGQRQISTIFSQASQYRVILEAGETFQQGPAALEHIHVKAASGEQIPLTTIAHVEERPSSLVVNHLAQLPAATISFNLAPGVALGDATRAIQKAKREIGLPASVQTGFQGAALAFESSLDNQLLLIIAAIVTMYIVLGVLYESFIHPVTILSTLPSAGIGALLALILTRNDLGIVAVIGIILLIGIVMKNAIMMIDFAIEAERTRHLAPRDAIFEACLLRFRPILMTTLCALLSAVPLMLGSGMGAELRQPLGITMVGGLLVSQVLTLFTTPVIYLGFGRLAQRLAGWWKADEIKVVTERP